MRVLVYGGRDYGCIPKGCPLESFKRYQEIAAKQKQHLNSTLDAKHVDSKITVLINGGALGADTLGAQWAMRMGILVETYKAIWRPDGKKGKIDYGAGPKRNQLMIDEGKPELAIGFPGGKGTQDMANRLRLAGIRIIEA